MTLPTPALRQPIGSDFESPDPSLLRAASVTPPWERAVGATTYFETGHGFLAVLADDLWSRGFCTIVVPAYLCDAVIAPFADRGWRIIPTPMTPSLMIDPDAALATVRALPEPPAVLWAQYFGRSLLTSDVTAIEELRKTGAFVIVDETHTIFGDDPIRGDIAFGSLRKLLPVADGAYARVVDPADAPASPTRPGWADHRWQVMDAKARSGHSPAIHEAFVKANHTLESHDDGTYQISPRSADMLRRLDYDELVARRRRNATVLADRLRSGGVAVLNPPGPDVLPSHLVISVDQRDALQRALAAEGIYCAAHWPKSSILSAQLPWRDDLLSVSVDHRYDPHHMAAAFETILRAARSLIVSSHQVH